MVRKYKTTTVKPAAPKRTGADNKIKVAIMNLKLTIGGKDHTFKSPIAEQILDKVRKVTVGHDQIEYFDKETNTRKSFTYCCGDKYEVSFESKEVDLQTTEKDCFDLPVIYEGDK